jgi:hypothetical protein
VNITVEISETSIHTYELEDVTSQEEAESLALAMFEEGEEADHIDILDIETDSYPTES